MKRAAGLNGRGAGWAGPYQIGTYLANAVQSAESRPPEGPGVYIVSEHEWRDRPDSTCGLLYVGRAPYVRYRIGQLLCEMFGFTTDSSDDEAYGHRGGQALWHQYCQPRQTDPLSLYVGWCSDCACLDCAEIKLAEMLTALLNLVTVRSCGSHRPPLDLAENCGQRAGTLNL